MLILNVSSYGLLNDVKLIRSTTLCVKKQKKISINNQSVDMLFVPVLKK